MSCDPNTRLAGWPSLPPLLKRQPKRLDPFRHRQKRVGKGGSDQASCLVQAVGSQELVQVLGDHEDGEQGLYEVPSEGQSRPWSDGVKAPASNGPCPPRKAFRARPPPPRLKTHEGAILPFFPKTETKENHHGQDVQRTARKTR